MQTTNESGRVDGKLFAIGILSVTACILLVGFLLVRTAPPAYAEAMNAAGGDYHLSTVRLSQNQEGVLVMDAAARRMVVYVWDRSDRALEMQAAFDYGIMRDQIEQQRLQSERERRR
jgi:hypothetical protein